MRVFNGREKEAGATRIVRMEQLLKGSKTYITNPETGAEKFFDYDFSFQTFDENDLSAGPYASQETVFETLGRPVMVSALEGRNVCLFAYGQTGAGKSFSMLGKPDQPGIIPRTCNAIFDRIAEENDPCYEHCVSIQVVEIYCEQINDLLANRKTWPDHGHKPYLTNHGYVVDTVKKPCFQYSDISEAFTFADSNRSVGSHALNPESSRAHTIYSISYERKKRAGGANGKVVETVVAALNLVDLAGSERTSVAHTEGQMLKEGNAINLSLTALGGCIKALSEGKKPQFRDSKLTLLLQGSMTNGRVIMIAALSPASICYDETMSTLRFADRIKKVKIKVSKNVTLDPVADIKKAMEEMKAQMQAEIDSLIARGGGHGQGNAEEDQVLQAKLKQQQEEAEQMRLAYENRLKELTETADDRHQAAADIKDMQSKALGGASMTDKSLIKVPHLRNLHEDPRLCETLLYTFKEGSTLIGRGGSDQAPDLEFNGMGIVPNHAEVKWVDGAVIITPGPRSRTLVNGRPIEAATELKHNFRLWLGNNYAFRFVYPGKEARGDQQFGSDGPDYAFAEQEIAQNASLDIDVPAAQNMPKETLSMLSDALKKVEQANMITKDLGKNTEFEVKMFKNRVTGQDDVAVTVKSGKGVRTWRWDKFELKLSEFATEWQRWERCEATNARYEPQKEDPFVDHDPQLVGEADVWLQSLANMMEFDCDAPVISINSTTEGNAKVSLLPCDANGGTGPWEDDDPMDPFVDEPIDLLETTIKFKVKIAAVVFDTCKTGGVCPYSNVWCRYMLNNRWIETPPVKGTTFNPNMGFEKEHSLYVDEKALELLKNGRMILQVYADVREDATNDELQEEPDPELDAEIEKKKKILADLEKQVADKRRLLAALL